LTNNPIFCAIDTSNIETATNLVSRIKPHIGGIKLGLEFFTSCGISGCHTMKEFDLPMFIDLKLHDIPNTVASALRGIFSLEPEYTTLHISGGSEMLKSSVSLKNELQSKTNLLGVTILTSFNDNTIEELGFGSSVKHSIEQLTSIAHESGLDGIVCSPQEVKHIKETYKNKLKLIVPGIRSSNNVNNDQKRTLSAKEAISAGADIIVVGRPITKAKDPAESAQKLLQEIM
jgi:orotidine-5'-phosphate decarboxylase